MVDSYTKKNMNGSFKCLVLFSKWSSEYGIYDFNVWFWSIGMYIDVIKHLPECLKPLVVQRLDGIYSLFKAQISQCNVGFHFSFLDGVFTRSYPRLHSHREGKQKKYSCESDHRFLDASAIPCWILATTQTVARPKLFCWD